jgi:hypothetical protein
VSQAPPASALWAGQEATRLLDHAESTITAATRRLRPGVAVTFGPTASGGSAVVRRVQAGSEALCATVRPRGAALWTVLRGDHGDPLSVLADAQHHGGVDLTAREAEQLMALAIHGGPRVAAPVGMSAGVMVTPWVTGPSLAERLWAEPAALADLLGAVVNQLTAVHTEPARPVRVLASPTGSRGLPRVIAEVMRHPAGGLPSSGWTGAEADAVDVLGRRVAGDLTRLAASLDTSVFARAGVAFGGLAPEQVLYPEDGDRPVLLSPALGPGGDITDVGMLLGRLHLLAVGTPTPERVWLVDGVDSWLKKQIACLGGRWRGWLSAVLTVWAATVYDRLATVLALPGDVVPLPPVLAGIADDPLPALTVLDVLTRHLRRADAVTALHATLTALSGAADSADPPPARPRVSR